MCIVHYFIITNEDNHWISIYINWKYISIYNLILRSLICGMMNFNVLIICVGCCGGFIPLLKKKQKKNLSYLEFTRRIHLCKICEQNSFNTCIEKTFSSYDFPI